MVVAFHLTLIVIAQEILGDSFRVAEVEAGAAHVFKALIRNTRLVNRQIRIRQDLQRVVAHVALVTVEVEIGVVGQVDRTRPVDRRTVFNGDTVILRQRKACRGGKISRETLIAIRRIQGEQHFPVVLTNNFPAAFIKPFRSAVQLVLSLAWQQAVLHAVEFKTALCDAVSIAPNGRAQKGGLSDILLGGGAAEQGLAHGAVRHRYAG